MRPTDLCTIENIKKKKKTWLHRRFYFSDFFAGEIFYFTELLHCPIVFPFCFLEVAIL